MSTVDLDEIRADLEYASSGIDGADMLYHPHALRAMRAAEKLLAEVQRLRAKLDGPCGSCHPCVNYADETWRAAGRRPPHTSEWDELRAEVERLRDAPAPITCVLCGCPVQGVRCTPSCPPLIVTPPVTGEVSA